MKELIKALQILLKYSNPTYPTICEHDIMYINKSIDPSDVSNEDIQRLEELGFDIEDDQFVSYKYGSA